MTGIDFIQDLGLVMLIAAAAAWICQRVGLPVVIGYITAGILIGPHTHSFALIADSGRIQSLAQIGLVFLIFSIGQGVRIQRLKKAGLPLIGATVIIAALVMIGCRLLGAALGWPGEYSLVLGGMLMVSSTAVLGKSLREANATHTRFGQTALTVTALDDLVAVVTLTVLASLIQVGQANSLEIFGTVIRLKAVIITMAIVALLLVPPLLKRLGHGLSSEVRSLAIVGLLLAMALISAKAGFSAALGAFLLGTIVSSTGKSEQVERALGGLTEVFAPVFFVAMGMMFDFKLLADVWPLTLGIFVMAIGWRTLAATTALLMVGHPLNAAARAALCLTPIGEFSLIIALTGVQGGLVPSSFYALAIGVCLLTSLTTPILIRASGDISGFVERKQPEFLAQWIGLYQEWIGSLQQRQRSNRLWKLTAPRLMQTAFLGFFSSGVLLFARPLYALAEKWLGADWPVAKGLPVVFWLGFGVLLLAPLIALWRNVEALAMICAELATHQRTRRSVLRPLFERLLKASALIAILVWLAALFPFAALPGWGLVLLAAAFVSVAAVFWRRFIRWQSGFEIELKHHLADSPFANGRPALNGWSKGNGQWRIHLAEITIRENTQAVNCAISMLPLRQTFSCTIVSLDRQGVVIPNPGAATILYPQDKILLLGQSDNLRRAEHWLNAELELSNGESQLSDLSLEHLTVPPSSRYLGRSLDQLALHSRFGIQIIGIERGRRPLLNPGRLETLQPGDQLLILGTSGQVNEMAFWLST